MENNVFNCKGCKKEVNNIIGLDDSVTIDLDVIGFIGDSVEQEHIYGIRLCKDCYLKLIELLNLKEESDLYEMMKGNI